MANFINDFKKMIDISEESELLAGMEEADKTEAGGVKAQDENFGLIVEKSQEMLRKKNAEYQDLLKEVVTVKNGFDAYREKMEKELRGVRKELNLSAQTNKELGQAQSTGATADAYTSGLARQIEELKQTLETAEENAARHKTRANEVELAREVAEAEAKANMEAMNAKMEAWKKRTEANQERARQEMVEMQDRLKSGGVGGGDDVEIEQKLNKATREAEGLRKEVEELQWEILQKQNTVGELTQNLEERGGRLLRYEKEEAGRVEGYKNEIISLEDKVKSLETDADRHQQALDEAKAVQERKLETLGDQQQDKHREFQALKAKSDDLERANTNLHYQLQNEKATVEQVMQHLDETKEEFGRREEAFTELYQDSEEARVRLQSLETQTITLQTELELQNEALSAADRDKRGLEEKVYALGKEVEQAREVTRQKEIHVGELEKSARSMGTAERELRFNLEKLKGELMMTAGGEKEAQQLMDSKEEELTRLRKQVTDLISQRDTISAKLRAAQRPETSSSRSRSVAARSSSPTVVDILRSAAEAPKHPRPHHTGPSSWTTTRATILILITLFLLLGMYHAQSSSIVTTSDEIELGKSISHLRSVVTAQEKLIEACKAKGV